MIVTREYCELLYLEAENIRRIYETHKDQMERLIHASNTISPEPDDMVDTGEKVLGDSELVMAGMTLNQIIKDHFKELIGYIAKFTNEDDLILLLK